MPPNSATAWPKKCSRCCAELAERRATRNDPWMADAANEPKLLAGGNPQIPKGDGPAPVQAYLDAMPGWKRDVGRRLDQLIV